MLSNYSAFAEQSSKRVAAGKAVAARTKMAREAQKKALIESESIIANNQLKQAEPPAVDPPVVDPPVVETPVVDAKNVLTTTQWLSVISIVVSLAGIYYKREEIKGVFAPKKPQVGAPPPVPPNTPVDVAPKRGIKSMD